MNHRYIGPIKQAHRPTALIDDVIISKVCRSIFTEMVTYSTRIFKFLNFSLLSLAISLEALEMRPKLLPVYSVI